MNYPTDVPHSIVGTDWFTFDGKNYVATYDYYSNFIVTDQLSETTSQIALKKKQFSRHGIPDVLIGSQYFSGEFHWYAYPWKFKHATLSPKHPQSNGEAENAVKTCNSLLKKAKLAKT